MARSDSDVVAMMNAVKSGVDEQHARENADRERMERMIAAVEALTAAVSMVAHLMENPPRKPYQR